MPDQPDPKQLSQAEYVASVGSICPECREAHRLTAGPLQADGATVWCDVDCEACGFHYQDIYTLTGYQMVPG